MTRRWICCPGATRRRRWAAWDGRLFCGPCIRSGLMYGRLIPGFQRSGVT